MTGFLFIHDNSFSHVLLTNLLCPCGSAAEISQATDWVKGMWGGGCSLHQENYKKGFSLYCSLGRTTNTRVHNMIKLPFYVVFFYTFTVLITVVRMFRVFANAETDVFMSVKHVQNVRILWCNRR